MASASDFVFTGSWPRAVFGVDTIKKIPAELRRLHVKRPVIVCSPTRVPLANLVKDVLEKAGMTVSGVVDKAVVHVPFELAEDSVSLTKAYGADSVISVGGGSAVGLGKAICYRTELPHICIPTTYSGSEMTAILGELKNGKKVAVTDPRILPSTVIYDVTLTLQLPRTLTAVSALNALAHSIESLYAEGANPVVSLVALESIKCLRESLPRVVVDPSSIKDRSSLLYGAFLAGMTVASTGIALQHKLAHTVAACCNLSHADTHAVLLPHTLAYNLPSLGMDVVSRLGLALVGHPEASMQDIVEALNTLLRTLDIPCALKDIGMDEGDIDRTADTAMEKPYWNPRSLEREKIRRIVRRAWAGELARVDL